MSDFRYTGYPWEVTIRLDDATLDRIIDDLAVRAGGERGMTCERLNVARWDLKAVLTQHGYNFGGT